MTAKEIVEELRALGAESIKKVLRNHGVQEPFFGVKIGDMKKIQKRIKKDYQLALDLYDTGNYDAMYLAGLVADDAKMTKKDLNHWVKMANGGALASATVPWVAAGSNHGYEIALEWIESEKENVAAAGWATLSSLVALKDDADLDLAGLKRLLERVQQDDSSAAGTSSLCNERLHDRSGDVREGPQRPRGAGSREGRQGFGRHGRHRVQSTRRSRVHRKGSRERSDRQEKAKR